MVFIAAGGLNDVISVAADGSGSLTLWDSTVDDESAAQLIVNPAGDAVAYRVTRDVDGGIEQSLYAQPISGGSGVELAVAYRFEDYRWSPDGEYLLYLESALDPAPAEYHVVAVDGQTAAVPTVRLLSRFGWGENHWLAGLPAVVLAVGNDVGDTSVPVTISAFTYPGATEVELVPQLAGADPYFMAICEVGGRVAYWATESLGATGYYGLTGLVGSADPGPPLRLLDGTGGDLRCSVGGDGSGFLTHTSLTGEPPGELMAQVTVWQVDASGATLLASENTPRTTNSSSYTVVWGIIDTAAAQ